MDRLEWAGAIGVGALVIILVSGMQHAQYLAAIVVLAGARPVYRAIKQRGIAEGLIEGTARGLSQAAKIIRGRRESS